MDIFLFVCKCKYMLQAEITQTKKINSNFVSVPFSRFFLIFLNIFHAVMPYLPISRF